MTKCNLCGGDVEYISNDLIFGKRYGSGYAYRCINCGAYVGTHKNSPKKAMGILADEEMRSLRIRCHGLFDSMWKTAKERTKAYYLLAEAIGISGGCHFSWMTKDELKSAVRYLEIATGKEVADDR